jgi:hypothetical protein
MCHRVETLPQKKHRAPSKNNRHVEPANRMIRVTRFREKRRREFGRAAGIPPSCGAGGATTAPLFQTTHGIINDRSRDFNFGNFSSRNIFSFFSCQHHITSVIYT